MDLWQQLQERYDALAQELSSPSIDGSKRHLYQKELSYLTTLLEKRRGVVALASELAEATAQACANQDPELAQLYQEEIADLKSREQQLAAELEDLMYPADERDDRSVYLEIRAGTGGQEAALFAADLLKMYTNYALKKGWKVSVESTSTTDLGGLREVVLFIKGKGVFGH